jgi:lipoyl synthase
VKAHLVLGATPTRRMAVPAIEAGSPSPLDAGAPAKLADALRRSGEKRVALIAVVRDDLADGGAAHVVACVRAIRATAPGVAIEVQACDFGGSLRAVRQVLASRPDVYHHPLVTIPRLLPKLQPGSDYVHALECLRIAKEEFEPVRTRSILCYGLGESRDELVASVADLRSVRLDELVLAAAPPALRRGIVAPDTVEKAATVARKLRFPSVEVVPDSARSRSRRSSR